VIASSQRAFLDLRAERHRSNQAFLGQIQGGWDMAKKKTITKSDLIDTLADKTAHKKKDVKVLLDTFVSEVAGALVKGNKIQITGFGTFEVRTRKARTGVKPGTTSKIKIPASKYPAFKPGKALKDQIKK
jgi:DNA-binding protein HU-beta